MTRPGKLTRSLWRATLLAVLLVLLAAALPAPAADDSLAQLLDRMNGNISSYLTLMSDVSCTERVTQEKLNAKGKAVQKLETTFDYLILLSNAGGELDLVESRLAPEGSAPPPKQRSPLLVSNGFATLFLIFHPYYSAGFQFAMDGEENVNGRKLTRIRFQHIRGTRAPAALAVRGREYPLDLGGMVWMDAESGAITRIVAGIESGMEDVGLRKLRSDVEYAPVTFGNSPQVYWLPAQAVVEVESRQQHWRNTHRFTGYKRFSVNTKEQVVSR